MGFRILRGGRAAGSDPPPTCPRCGLELPRGAPSCRACAGAAAFPLVTTGTRAGGGGGGLTGLAVLILLALAVFPQALSLLALPGPAAAIERSAPLRALVFLSAMGLAVIGTVGSRRRRQAKLTQAWGDFAARIGGVLSFELPALGGARGPGGPVVKSRVGEWTVILETVHKGSSAIVRMSARVTLERELLFLLCPENLAGKIGASARLWTLALAGARTAATRDAAVAAHGRALDRLAFMAGDDVSTGDPEFDRAFILKASDGPAARDLFGDPAVRHRLLELRHPRPCWAFLLSPLDADSTALLEFQEPGPATDVERLVAIRGLVAAVLESLTQMRAVTERAAGA